MIQHGVAQEIIDEFARISPLASIHIFFTGQYSFNKSNGNIDLNELAKLLETHLKQHVGRFNPDRALLAFLPKNPYFKCRQVLFTNKLYD